MLAVLAWRVWTLNPLIGDLNKRILKRRKTSGGSSFHFMDTFGMNEWMTELNSFRLFSWNSKDERFDRTVKYDYWLTMSKWRKFRWENWVTEKIYSYPLHSIHQMIVLGVGSRYTSVRAVPEIAPYLRDIHNVKTLEEGRYFLPKKVSGSRSC